MTPTDTPRERATPSSSRTWLRPLFFGLGAAAIYGGWAFRANLSAGTAAALRAALTQACVSCATTGGMSVIIEGLFRIGRTPERGFWLAAVGASMTGAFAVITAHVLSGTPNVLLTVGPTIPIATTFAFLYAWGLRVGKRRAR